MIFFLAVASFGFLSVLYALLGDPLPIRAGDRALGEGSGWLPVEGPILRVGRWIKISRRSELLGVLARNGEDHRSRGAALETSLSVVAEADRMLSELAKDGHVEVRAHGGRPAYAPVGAGQARAGTG